MSEFSRREQAFENKFAHDNEVNFKIAARAAYLLGKWAAGLLGLHRVEAKEYGRQAMKLSMSKTGDAGLIAKIESDLLSAKLSLTHHELERKLSGFYSRIRKRVYGET